MSYNRVELAPLVGKPLPWGLTSVANDVTPDGGYWMGGVSWSQTPTTKSSEWDPFKDPAENKDLSSLESIGTVSPMVIYMPYSCPAAGPIRDIDILVARERLEAATSAAIETMFWSWAMGTAESLAVTGDASVVVGALGKKMSNVGAVSQGMIHMPAFAAEQYLTPGRFDDLGPLTARGDRVVVGAGYGQPGASLNDAVVVSGPVAYLQSEITVIESAEHIASKNQRILLAERYIAFQADDNAIFSAVVQPTN